VVPICVDPKQVSPVVHRNGDVPTVLHLGTMFWPPNIAGVLWFAREVLPLIHEQLPTARLVVVGKNPPPAVQALAKDPRIRVTGYVADPAPYLEAADAFIVPLHAAGGMRVKILDAWLWKLPIISTTIGAEGIDCRDGENILIADDTFAFAQATLRLLTDLDLNQRVRANGRTWVEAHYGWSVVYRHVDRVYTHLLGTGQIQN
jgi:glycosyltransferase involved in cell wall biosynthesis